MAGKKYGVVLQERVPGSYHALPQADRDIGERVLGELMGKYEGRVDLLRRYWTGAFDAEVTDVFVIEFDDPADYHDFFQELNRRLGESGDPDRFGYAVSTRFGVNPDAD